MNLKQSRIYLAASGLGLALIGLPMRAGAQAPAGPLPAAQPQPPSAPDARPQEQAAPPVKPPPSILGAWKLNRDESDDPRKKMQDARSADAGRGGGGGGRGGGRLGIPGMGGGAYGGGRRSGGGNESDQDRQQMQG